MVRVAFPRKLDVTGAASCQGCRCRRIHEWYWMRRTYLSCDQWPAGDRPLREKESTVRPSHSRSRGLGEAVPVVNAELERSYEKACGVSYRRSLVGRL